MSNRERDQQYDSRAEYASYMMKKADKFSYGMKNLMEE